MRLVLAHPLLKGGVGLAVVAVLDERKRQTIAATNTPQIEMNHFRPRTGINVGLAIGITLKHRMMGVPHDHRMDGGILIK